MLGQLNNLYETSLNLLPFATLLVGFGGSLHCIGMCSGLVIASSNNNIKKNITYQLGRLLSYLLITTLTLTLGHYLLNENTYPFITHVTSFIFGFLLIYWGISLWPGNKTIHIKLPKIMNHLVNKLWGNILTNNQHGYLKYFNSFFLGSLSIFLPCGLLYGVILAISAPNNALIAILSIISFWLGTLPALVFSTQIVDKMLRPLAKKMPKFSSLIVLTIGVLTVINRAYAVYIEKTCH